MRVLVTGGAGYIGSHICVELLNAGYNVVVIDNLINSSDESIKRVEDITKKKITFYKEDLLNELKLRYIFDVEQIDFVIHLAGLKAVGDSVYKPIEYYTNNVVGTLNLLNVMKLHNKNKIIFSSSATVYGNPQMVPISENTTCATTNPYGSTKLIIENLLKDLYISNNDWKIIILRYFNPIGAHESGLIGENPQGIPNNLFPYIMQVAIGKLEKVRIFGNDYDTPDGTGIRDYIHVVDLAKGHVNALKSLDYLNGVQIYNIGTGSGYSVLDIINTFIEVTGVSVPYEVAERREGDVAICYSDPSRAEKELSWKAMKNLREMCEDAWRWQKNSPNGYDSQLISDFL